MSIAAVLISALFILSHNVTAITATSFPRFREAGQEKEQRELRREEFKAKLEQIRDERKKALVERIDDKLEDINEKRTERWSEALEKLSAILTRVEEKLASTSGDVDKTAANEAISNAKTAIETAQTAVSDQAEKDYTAQITDETTLRNTVGAAFSSLQSDLRATHKITVDAKQAVMNAAKEVRKLQGQNHE